MPLQSFLGSKFDNKECSPWASPRHPDILFPIQAYESLIEEIGWEPNKWLNYWLKKNLEKLAVNSWAENTKIDWLWGLGLPILSDVKRYLSINNQQTLLGLSAVPGCGKSTLANWLATAAKELNWSLGVISLDDFYMCRNELEVALKGNPWNVPRGLPGSHSMNILEDSLNNWKDDGCLFAPSFDKALKNGMGDRSGWNKSYPKVLILEGWFLGCSASNASEFEIDDNKCLDFPLTNSEKLYRLKVQKKLADYQKIWKLIDRLWHIKAPDIAATAQWKTEQENQMYEKRGTSLSSDSLNSFIRMIQSSIPQKSLRNINSNVVAEVNQKRQILWVGSTNNYK